MVAHSINCKPIVQRVQLSKETRISSGSKLHKQIQNDVIRFDKPFISARLPLILQYMVETIFPDEGISADLQDVQDLVPNWHLQWGLC